MVSRQVKNNTDNNNDKKKMQPLGRKHKLMMVEVIHNISVGSPTPLNFENNGQ